MRKMMILGIMTVILGGCSIATPTSQDGIRKKPPELYSSKEECEPHAKEGYCLETLCTQGESDGSKSWDGKTHICEETWQGWVPVNEVFYP